MTDYRKYSFQELKDGKASKSSDWWWTAI
jgi:hypothetical protein